MISTGSLKGLRRTFAHWMEDACSSQVEQDFSGLGFSRYSFGPVDGEVSVPLLRS